MSTIVTRSGKGAPLTNTEVDANFTNLNTDKLETSVWSASEAASITAADTANWDTALTWGNHADAGYAKPADITAAIQNKASLDDATALAIALG